MPAHAYHGEQSCQLMDTIVCWAADIVSTTCGHHDEYGLKACGYIMVCTG